MSIISKLILINGSPQWVYIQKEKGDDSGFLFLHGGPGWSDAPWAHRYCQSIWGKWSTIHWDQRGSNRSEELLTQGQSQFTMDEAIEDTLSLCRTLKNEYGFKHIVLVGHSWGALLGTLAVHRAPELFAAYIGIGQLVSNQLSEPLALDFSRKKAKNLGLQEMAHELDQMPEDFFQTPQLLFRQRELLFKLGGEFVEPLAEEIMIQWTEEGLPEYRSHLKCLYRTCEQIINLMWSQVIQRDLFKEVKEIQIPVYLLLGRHDWVTASSVAEQWFHQLNAPAGKKAIWFEKSGHWPHIEENEKFLSVLARLHGS